MVLEVNLLGMHEGRIYPHASFWEEAAAAGNRVILGRDAHSPKHLLDSKTEERCLELVHKYGLELVETVPLVSI